MVEVEVRVTGRLEGEGEWRVTAWVVAKTNGRAARDRLQIPDQSYALTLTTPSAYRRPVTLNSTSTTPPTSSWSV